MGYVSASGPGIYELNNQSLFLLILLTLFSYANFVLIGYLKDISADRATNYKTFPVVFGWNKTMLVGDLFAILSTLFCYFLIGHSQSVSFSIFLLATGIALSGQLFGHFTNHKNERNASYAIVSTVRGLILWHIAVIVHYQPDWLIYLVIFYALFELTLYLRPEKDQI